MPSWFTWKFSLRFGAGLIEKLKGIMDILSKAIFRNLLLAKCPIDDPAVHAHANSGAEILEHRFVLSLVEKDRVFFEDFDEPVKHR